MTPEPFTRMYRLAMRIATPVVRWWGRLEVVGLESLPRSGPALVAANHDSNMDPVVIGVAGLGRRQIRALAKAELWNVRGLAPVLDGMGQVPILRGEGDQGALDRAIRELREQEICIGVFPEGTRSLGRELRARSGIGRLAQAVPKAEIICARATGTTDFARFPRRPRARVEFFRPAGGNYQPGEDPLGFSERILTEIREGAPRAHAGRNQERMNKLRAKKGLPPLA